MTALNFPSSPASGQTFPSPPVSGRPVYTWDGEKWTTIGGNIGTGYAPIDSPLFTGDPRAPTPAPTDNDNSLATTAFVTAKINAIPPPASVAEFLANSAGGKTISVGTAWGAATVVQITEVGGSFTPNFATGIDFLCVPGGGGRALLNPANVKSGQKGIIYIAGGSITIWGSIYRFANGGIKPVSTGGIDAISYAVSWDPSYVMCNFTGNLA